MFRKILQGLFALIGVSLGYGIVEFLLRTRVMSFSSNYVRYGVYGIGMVLVGAIFYIAAPWIFNKIEKILLRLEKKLSSESKDDLTIGFVGIILGIIVAFLISLPLNMLRLSDILSVMITLVSIIIYVLFSAFGYRLAMKNKEDIKRYFTFNKRKNQRESKINEVVEAETIQNSGNVTSKLLDTSVIIDGRIKQIASTGFIEGKIIIPNFVLQELQFIADSADEVKRERGRRGLDIVNDLQKNSKIQVEISDRDYIETKEVDIKLLKYAAEVDASIVTNDFNLNKLAIVQGLKVLNINDLANSVKTVVIPGEKMIVTIIKEGREKNQGLAYLDDGTMIVVEEAKHLIGETLEVVVTTVLQTAAGKMIFTKILNS